MRVHKPSASQAPLDLRLSAQVVCTSPVQPLLCSIAQAPGSDLAVSLAFSACIKALQGLVVLSSPWGPPWMCRYGVGKWRLIQKDEDYGPILTNRSNVDLKVSFHCCMVQVQCRWVATLPESCATCCCFGAAALLVSTAQATGHGCAALPGAAACSQHSQRGLWVVRERRTPLCAASCSAQQAGTSMASLLSLQDKWRNLNMDSIKNKKRDVAGDGGEGGLLDDDDFLVGLDSCSAWRLLWVPASCGLLTARLWSEALPCCSLCAHALLLALALVALGCPRGGPLVGALVHAMLCSSFPA